MGIVVYSFLWVMQDLHHQPYQSLFYKRQQAARRLQHMRARSTRFLKIIHKPTRWPQHAVFDMVGDMAPGPRHSNRKCSVTLPLCELLFLRFLWILTASKGFTYGCLCLSRTPCLALMWSSETCSVPRTTAQAFQYVSTQAQVT